MYKREFTKTSEVGLDKKKLHFIQLADEAGLKTMEQTYHRPGHCAIERGHAVEYVQLNITVKVPTMTRGSTI